MGAALEACHRRTVKSRERLGLGTIDRDCESLAGGANNCSNVSHYPALLKQSCLALAALRPPK
ncbi:hypothetical protein GMO_20220 [Gluconobacter morbifer G707]|uniref:Uncharacterized protein n=1 Tax=Gluconobacter morbifer G707 TaxID=1088869 RepID=G6XKK6_9PROT|nr:hypothetical protein GMO_20220 [Gluconobacter morbifer G707]